MKRLAIPVMALALLFIIPFYFVKAEEESSEIKINNEFKCSKLNLKKNFIILDYKSEDVNGDNIKDNIILIGQNPSEITCPLRENIRVVVQDCKTNRFYSISPGRLDDGYNARLFIGDFDGDRLNDVLVSIGNIGSGGCSYYSLFSFKKNKCKYLIDEEKFSRGLDYTVKYINDFRVSILNRYSKKLYIVNVENKKDTYTNLGIYKDSGELVKYTEGGYDFIGDLVPVDIDKDGIYELKTIQAIWGICHVDTLAYGKGIWKYSYNKMLLQNFELLEVARPGNREKLQKVIPVLGH